MTDSAKYSACHGLKKETAEFLPRPSQKSKEPRNCYELESLDNQSGRLLRHDATKESVCYLYFRPQLPAKSE